MKQKVSEKMDKKVQIINFLRKPESSSFFFGSKLSCKLDQYKHTPFVVINNVLPVVAGVRRAAAGISDVVKNRRTENNAEYRRVHPSGELAYCRSVAISTVGK